MNNILALGSRQIPMNDIKSYGISKMELAYEKIYEPTEENSTDYKWRGRLNPISDERRRILDTESKEYFVKKVDYLFLCTYKQQTFMFPAPLVDFNIYEKLKELNNHLG